MESIIWLILFAVLVVIEIMTLGLTTIWFAGGALVAFLAALLGAPLMVQIILFLIVSILALVITRPLLVKDMGKKKVRTNADRLVEQTAEVIEEICNTRGTGRVVIAGVEWMARSSNDDEEIPLKKLVKILSIEGATLIVQPTTENTHRQEKK